MYILGCKGCEALRGILRSMGIHFGMFASIDMAARCQVCRLFNASQPCVAAPPPTALLLRSALRSCSHSLSSGSKKLACNNISRT